MAAKQTNENDEENKAIDPLEVALIQFDNRGYRESLGGVNPTGASALMEDERGEEVLVGKCLRQVWYSKNHVPKTNPATDNNKMMFMVGNSVESELQKMWAGAGVLLGSNIKLRKNIAKNPKTDPEIMLSGEVDALIRLSEWRNDEHGVPRQHISPTKAIGIEVKTKYGFFGKAQIMGAKTSTYEHGFPQIEHLMQTALYLHTRKALEEYHDVEIPYFVLVYVLRDNGIHKSFRVELEDGYDGRIIVKDMDGNELKPKSELSLEWGVQVRPMNLTIDMMRERFLKHIENMKSDPPPPRDFDLRYSDEKAERLFEKGVLSKTKKAKHEKNSMEEIGDWNCSYCDWKGVCYPQGIFTIPVEDGALTVEEALLKSGVGGSETS